jgi:Brp/Blh family beta-carotene 15,15'-monooxygenase
VIAGSAELTLLAVAVFLVGTPHGALDARLASEWLQPRLGRLWALPFVGGYLALTGVTLALWLTAPGAALALFLLLAAIHFGQHDPPSHRLLPVLVRGSLPSVVAAAAHPEAIKSIFTLLAGRSGEPIAALLGGPMLLLWLAGAALTLLIETRKVELLLLSMLFALAPPLVAFAAYYALIHTPRALATSRRQGERWGDLLAVALPWSLAAVALALLLWMWLAIDLEEGPALVRTIFWWLSALTVPHMLLHLLTDIRSAVGSCKSDSARSPANAASGAVLAAKTSNGSSARSNFSASKTRSLASDEKQVAQ